MEWNTVTTDLIRKEIEVFDTTIEEINDEQVIVDNGVDSITLPNGKVLSMLPIPIPLKVAIHDVHVPDAKDVIIPDPHFDIHDIMSFECARDENPILKAGEYHFDDLDALKSELSSFITSSNPNLSLVPICNKLNEDQWLSLLPDTIPSDSQIMRFLLSTHTPELGKALFKKYYCQLRESDNVPIISHIIKQCRIYSLSNSDLQSWIESLHNLFQNSHLVYHCLQDIHNYS